MEHNDNSGWVIQRRMEGVVNKHMADVALETLQQRLTVVTDEMHSLAEHVSRRTDEIPNDAVPPRTEVNFDVESFTSTYNTGGTAEKGISTVSETAGQRKIISLLVEIKEEQRRQWAVLRDLQARLQGPVPQEEDEVESPGMDLPLKTLEQLDETESLLEDPAAQRRMVCHLSRMGGASVDDTVRRLMHAVLSFAVGSELNWVGRGQKRSFRSTRLQGVLFRALKRTPVGKEATHHQYADVVKKWLRFAPFRQGGSGRRHYRPPTEFPGS